MLLAWSRHHSRDSALKEYKILGRMNLCPTTWPSWNTTTLTDVKANVYLIWCQRRFCKALQQNAYQCKWASDMTQWNSYRGLIAKLGRKLPYLAQPEVIRSELGKLDVVFTIHGVNFVLFWVLWVEGSGNLFKSYSNQCQTWLCVWVSVHQPIRK